MKTKAVCLTMYQSRMTAYENLRKEFEMNYREKLLVREGLHYGGPYCRAWAISSGV